MTRSSLKVAGVVAIVFALSPLVPWAIAEVFESVNRSWLDAPGAMRVTIPVALALMALAFASHGIALHHELVDSLEDNFNTLVAATVVPAGQMLGGQGEFGAYGNGGTVQAAPSAGGGQSGGGMAAPEAPAAPQAPSLSEQQEKKNRRKQRAKQRIKGEAGRTFENALQRKLSQFRPRF